MGFLVDRPELKLSLRTTASYVRALSQREYQELVATWRNHFEEMLASGNSVSGARAEALLRAVLPADVFVFSIPGYEFLPSATSPRQDPAYGFEVKVLVAVDFAVLNPEDAIIVDHAMTFTCLCTHEAGMLAEPIFAHARVGPD